MESKNIQSTAEAKIKGIYGLSEIVGFLKSEGKTIVHCHGVFDLLHIGHIRHFQEAKNLGDVLIVTLTPDRFVNKGPGRPAFNQELRLEAIASLEIVDYVAINIWPTASETIKVIAPDYYVKGSEYQEEDLDRTGGIKEEKDAIGAVGGKLAFTDDITFSSSNLINRRMPVFPKEVSDYIAEFSSKYTTKDVLRYIDRASSLKVLVIGETIIDEYVYCETLGKSGKEPVLVTRQIGCERMAGGIVAIANHVSAISDHVKMLTFQGLDISDRRFVKDKLNSKVDDIVLPLEGDRPTIIKRRFVEEYPFQKLFELYVMDDGETTQHESAVLCHSLEEIVSQFDVVIATDYGHGMIGPDAVEILCQKPVFLAINTQVNAGNMGFNTVSKYTRADFICVSENEIRLEARSRRSPLQDIVLDVSRKLGCERIVITRGPNGCLCYSPSDGFVEVPALAMDVVDRIGAGDAVFSVSSLLAALQAPMEMVGFVGNVAGAEAVATVGNRNNLERVPFFRHVETLLK